MLEVINGRSIYAGQIYRHFKNKLYQIVAVANHSETGEKLVIYQQLYGRYEVYARPLQMFMSEVDRDKYPMAKQKYRFELVEREELANVGNGMNTSDNVNISNEINTSNNVDTSNEENISNGIKDLNNVNTFNTTNIQDGKNILSDTNIQNDRNALNDTNIQNDRSALNGTNIQNDKFDEEVSIINRDDYFFEEERINEDEVNPYLLKFLDADTYEEKRNILVRMKGEMTNRLIDDIAASLDVAVENGDIEERYISLLNCIDMMVRFEVNRFR